MNLLTAVHKVDRLRRQFFGLPEPLVKASLLGKEFTVRHGSIRKESDYDDAWLYACALHSEIVFDVGSNIGQSALLILLSPQVKELVLVEANPAALSIAAENLLYNHLSGHTRFVVAFASDEIDKQVQFWTVGSGAAGSMYDDHAKTAQRRNQSIWTPTVTLDFLIETYHLTPDLVKIDVEGAESLVLVGAGKCAAQQKTRFFVEMHSNANLPMGENAIKVIEWCKTVNYSAWYLKEKVILDAPELIEKRGRCHLLLQPQSWEFPQWLLPVKQSAPLSSVSLAEQTSEI